MKSIVLIATVVLGTIAQGKDHPQPGQAGTLVKMESRECGVDEKSGNSVVGDLVGTDSAHKKTQALLCQEYVLQSDKMIYRIRPTEEKHPVLLPIGEPAHFRIQKDKMVLRVEDGDNKERKYSVVSVTPLQDKQAD